MSVVGNPVIVNVFAAAACTAIPDSVRGETRRRCVGRRDRLRAERVERDGEGVLARVGRGEGVVGWQDGVGVAAGQGYGASVAGRHVTVRVVGGDGDATGRARRVARGKPVTFSVCRRRRPAR